MLGQDTIVGFLPRDPGRLMHCRRVAALGQALAHQLFLSTEHKCLLYSASLLHHCGLSMFTGKAMNRLMADLMGSRMFTVVGSSALGEEVRDVLECFTYPGSGSAEHRLLAEIIRMADDYDCEYEIARPDGRTMDALFSELREGAAGGLWPAHLVDALEHVATAAPVGEPGQWQIPSFAPAAARILGLMSRATITARNLEAAAGSDPAIAGKLMQLANSAMFGGRVQISTLASAITRLGFRTTRKVITASLARPILASGRLESLWRHSLEAADLAEQIAERTGEIDGGEAYLCGLLHDAGALVLSRLPLYDAARLQGLQDGGCGAVYAEHLILRQDHAELGGRLAEYWRLPPHLCQAIRYHHRPEKAEPALAHLLYVVEFLTCREEDIPSRRRLEMSLKRIGLSFEDAALLRASSVVEWLAAA